MEKRNPHHKLAQIKKAVARLGIVSFTRSSIDGGREMGLNSADLMAAVLSIERTMYFKSMTTYQDHKQWQDGYHVPTAAGMAYVKFMLRTEGAIVISFKRKSI